MTPRDMNMAHVAADDDDDDNNLSVFYSRFIICIRRMERVNRKYGTVWFAQPRRKRRTITSHLYDVLFTQAPAMMVYRSGEGWGVMAIWKHVIAKAELGPRLFFFFSFFSRPPPPARSPQAAPALTQRWCEPCRCMTAPMCDRSH